MASKIKKRRKELRRAKELGIKVSKSLDLKMQTQQLINETNKKLRRLEKAGHGGQFASKFLYRKLKGNDLKAIKQTKSGKLIKMPKNASIQDLRVLNKTLEEYVTSKTSTIKGIEETIDKTKESLLLTFKGVGDKDITMQDIQDYYDMLSDKDFVNLIDYIGASEGWSFIDEAREQNLNQEQFIKMLEDYNVLADDNLKASSIRLYNKFVKE